MDVVGGLVPIAAGVDDVVAERVAQPLQRAGFEVGFPVLAQERRHLVVEPGLVGRQDHLAQRTVLGGPPRLLRTFEDAPLDILFPPPGLQTLDLGDVVLERHLGDPVERGLGPVFVTDQTLVEVATVAIDVALISSLAQPMGFVATEIARIHTPHAHDDRVGLGEVGAVHLPVSCR